MKRQEIPLLKKINKLTKELESFEMNLIYRYCPWYSKLLNSLARADIWLSRPKNQEEIRFEIYQIQQWQQHQHLLDIGKCDNTCDDWLECSEDWNSDKEWARIFAEKMKGEKNGKRENN